MKRKLIKRILLWGVGLPVSLIVALAAVFFACYAIAPDSTEKAVVKVISIFTPLGTLIENTESVHPAYVALEAKDYDRVMQICDSLHEHSNVTDIELNLVRSTICLNTKRFRAAEIYLKKAIASYTGQEYEAGHYASASINLGRRLCDKGEYAEAVKIITTAIDKLEHNKGRVLMQSSSMPRLHTRLAVSLAKLGKTDEADARFRQAIKSYDDKDVDLNIMYDSEEKKDEYNRMQLEVAESAIAVFMEEGRYDMAKKWFEKEDNAMAYILTNDSLANEDGGLHQYRYHLMKAQMLEHDGDRAGADSEYRRCTEFPASQNSGAIVSRYRYLTASERWSEALEMYTKLDTAIFGNIYSLDNISLFLMPHYRALRGTGQTAKAQQLADTLSLRLGEAIQANKNDDAAELATIYETQQKEAQIAERDAELNR
jgi:tetratricopeptide (TPR) repeat protein